MLPIDFPGTNANLSKPDSMTDEECEGLRARLDHTFRGAQYTTCWQPSYEDIELLCSGQALVIELHLDETIFASINTREPRYPSLMAQSKVIVWVPGSDEISDIKSGNRIYITFLCTGFPVISVYVNEQ